MTEFNILNHLDKLEPDRRRYPRPLRQAVPRAVDDFSGSKVQAHSLDR